jgi:C-terminal processing protease CtpA/Prc
MKSFVKSILVSFLLLISFGCTDRDDQPVPASLQVKDFIWKGLNLYYLWQTNVPDLADDKFGGDQNNLNTYLATFPSPLDLFNHLKLPNTTDRFSVIYSDYSVLEGVLSGTTMNNGMDYGLRYKSGSTTDIYGWVRYILPDSDAASKPINRGTIFYAINGTPLTVDNYKTLLSNTTYTINLADYDNGNITPNGQSVTLTKTNITENPIFINSVITQGTHNIGYLMYNGFYSSYDDQLNSVFGNFAAQNVTDLVLDLRYNSGGAVTSATKLASMITGQFTGLLFAKLTGNAKVQAFAGDYNYNFISGLNSLHLNKVYILTTKGTASASELVINGLKPYINVVQIGTITTGKNVASRTLYDSFDFSKNNINPNHKYAMQPIVYKSVNQAGYGDYSAGLSPTVELAEDMNNMGTLGDINEPLLNIAINQIIASGKQIPQNPSSQIDFNDAKSIDPLRSEMYVGGK